MGIFDKFKKQKITRGQWLDFAFNQIMSENWHNTRKRLFDHMKDENIIPDDITKEFFTSSILGALLELLTFVTTKYDRGLGLEAHFQLNKYIDSQQESIRSNIKKAYEICNAKVGESSGQYSGIRAIALGCSEHIGVKCYDEFVDKLELEFYELVKVWLLDLNQYRFIS